MTNFLSKACNLTTCKQLILNNNLFYISSNSIRFNFCKLTVESNIGNHLNQLFDPLNLRGQPFRTTCNNLTNTNTNLPHYCCNLLNNNPLNTQIYKLNWINNISNLSSKLHHLSSNH